MAAKCSLFYTWSQQAVPTGINADAIWATLSFGSKAAHQCGLRPLSRALGTIAKYSAADLPGSVGECFSRSRCQCRSDVMRILFAVRQRSPEGLGDLSLKMVILDLYSHRYCMLHLNLICRPVNNHPTLIGWRSILHNSRLLFQCISVTVR